MAVNPLNILALLRPWRSAGISHLLASDAAADVSDNAPDEDVHSDNAPDCTLRAEAHADPFSSADPFPAAPDAPPTAHGGQSSGQSSGQASGQLSGQSSGQSSGRTHGRMPEQAPEQTFGTQPGGFTPSPGTSTERQARSATSMAPGGPLSFASAASAPAKAASAGIASGTAPGATSGTAPEKGAGPSSGNDSEPETWPELWQRLFQKASPAPLLWSYRELASDLLHPDQSSSARSTVLRALIKALALPAGTSTFWPLQLDASELPPSEQAQGLPFCCSTYFLSGLSRLQPKIVIIFGDQESDSGRPPYTSDILGGRAYVYLPPLTQFSQSQEAMGKAVNVLRSMVMQFSILSTP